MFPRSTRVAAQQLVPKIRFLGTQVPRSVEKLVEGFSSIVFCLFSNSKYPKIKFRSQSITNHVESQSYQDGEPPPSVITKALTILTQLGFSTCLWGYYIVLDSFLSFKQTWMPITLILLFYIICVQRKGLLALSVIYMWPLILKILVQYF